MKSPFIFNRIVTGKDFIGREKEIKKLLHNFRDAINTFIISPRRTGKTSLVSHTSKEYQNIKENKKKKVFVFINLWNIRTEEEFYELYANRILKMASGSFKEIVEHAKSFLDRLKPSIDLEYESVKLKFGFSPQKSEIADILDLPQKLAVKKKKEFIICLDEFQDIEYFKDSLSFQKNLRSHWQQHNNVSYILYGSKKHMLSNLFNNSSMPFYRFGDVIYLKHIEYKKFEKFIIDRFDETNKHISKEYASLITRILKQHPYYIQQYCNILWQNTEKEVNNELVQESFDEFIEYNSGQFDQILQNLSNSQLNFLKALSDGIVSFHAQDVLLKYKLGSSANVTSIKKVLTEKEIIEKSNDVYVFSDPVFNFYLKSRDNMNFINDFLN